jgi:hypothetical protein
MLPIVAIPAAAPAKAAIAVRRVGGAGAVAPGTSAGG